MSAGYQCKDKNHILKFHPDLVSKDKVDAKVKHQLIEELDVALIGPHHGFGSVTEYMINVVYEEEDKEVFAPAADDTDDTDSASAGSGSPRYDHDVFHAPGGYDAAASLDGVPPFPPAGAEPAPAGMPFSPFSPALDGAPHMPPDHHSHPHPHLHPHHMHHMHHHMHDMHHHASASASASASGSGSGSPSQSSPPSGSLASSVSAAAAASFGVHALDVESEAVLSLAGPASSAAAGAAGAPHQHHMHMDAAARAKAQQHASATKVPAIRREPGTEIEDPFFVCDLGFVARKLMQWNRLFPRITPFYAVKCNPNPGIVRTLARLGAGFDCASKAEIALVLEHGGVTDPSRIVYANPCKAIPELRYAKSQNIAAMTFDNADELRKLAKYYPEADLLLRIRTDDDHSAIPLGTKFGAELHDCEHLIQLAKELGLHLLGVSFHVGSGCYDVLAYNKAIRDARLVFDMAKKAGIELQLLDIGGGYPGTDEDPVTIEQIAEVVNPLIEELFPASSGIRVISEPGRYFAEGSHTLCVEIIGKHNLKTNKVKALSGDSASAAFSPARRQAFFADGDAAIPPLSLDGDPLMMMPKSAAVAKSAAAQAAEAAAAPADINYYINEGVYGCFKDRILIQAKFKPHILWSQRFTKGQNITFEDGLLDESDRKMLDRAARIANMKVVASNPDNVSETAAEDGAADRDRRFVSRIYGPSNHHLDCVSDSVVMPELNPGDWLYFTRMGAYTVSLASCFNGNNPPDTRYVWTEVSLDDEDPVGSDCTAL